MKRVNILAAGFTPEMVSDEDLDTDLPLHHSRDYTKRSEFAVSRLACRERSSAHLNFSA